MDETTKPATVTAMTTEELRVFLDALWYEYQLRDRCGDSYDGAAFERAKLTLSGPGFCSKHGYCEKCAYEPVVTDRAQGVDCYECEGNTPHTHRGKT